MDEVTSLLKEAREGGPSAEALKSMREVLERRLQAIREELADLAEDAPERPALKKQVAILERQVAALAEEAAITEFVEESTLAAVRMSQLRGA